MRRVEGVKRVYHTNLIHLNSDELSAEFAQEGFGSFAVGAIGFAEYGWRNCTLVQLVLYDKINGEGTGKRAEHTDGIIINDTLRLGLCGGHGFWGGA